ncbi:PLP-dependent aminotransferase family protein [Pararobbsia alpina]|uniref:aminotransferase-like domain-containing protein n=1 Tax=Pararobbsia alpina TaxID=621374 RepID=UPI0039A48F92
MKLYEKLVSQVEHLIHMGVYQPGERIPSVRHACYLNSMSVTTVLRAYLQLESRGVIESRPQSGYFVRRPVEASSVERASIGQPQAVRNSERDVSVSASERRDGAVPDTSRVRKGHRSSSSDSSSALTYASTYASTNASTHESTYAPTHTSFSWSASDPAPDAGQFVLATLREIARHGALPLGSPYPDPSIFPTTRLNRYAAALARQREAPGVLSDLPPGDAGLIHQIARRYADAGCYVDPGEIVMTVGATEALNLCLQVVAKPGDTIAIESPTFYAHLQAIEKLGMRALEVPTHPEAGIDIDALTRLCDTQRIAACVVMPNFQNPLGFQMSDERKQLLVERMNARGIPIIENDVYRELAFEGKAPLPLKRFDRAGLVLHFSSFSKTLSPDQRIGWAMPGRFRQAFETLKFFNTLTTPLTPQRAIAEYLRNDGYDAHLRRMRQRYSQQAAIMRAMVSRFFPSGTRISKPAGGYLLWIELPNRADSMALYSAAIAEGITVGAGTLFSRSERYSSFIRLNYSYAWSANTEQAIRTLGRLAGALPSREPLEATLPDELD